MYEEIRKKYKLIYDHHTHTLYTHGKGSILDNVRVAHEKGIPEIAITEHGPGNYFCGFKLKDMDNMKRDIEEAKREYPDVNVLFGIELNLVRNYPYIDINPDFLKQFDIVLCGFHYSCKNGGTIANWLWKVTHKELRYHIIEDMYQADMSMLLVKNTSAMVSAILNNKIDILTHVGDKGPFDICDVCEACEKAGTLLEINLKHKHLNREELLIAKNYNVNFVISSDAHDPKDVGTFEPQLKLALDCGIDINRIVNVVER